jgi:3-methylcrotonyl-CoA carboxylase alpha subunit
MVNGWLSAHYNGVSRRHRVFVDGVRITLHDGERRNQFEHAPAFAFVAVTSVDTDRVVAPMPGRIVVIKAKPGDEVSEGAELLVMEAMKMELTLRSPRDGRVEAIQTQAGEFVDADAILVRLEPAE